MGGGGGEKARQHFCSLHEQFLLTGGRGLSSCGVCGCARWLYYPLAVAGGWVAVGAQAVFYIYR